MTRSCVISSLPTSGSSQAFVNHAVSRNFLETENLFDRNSVPAKVLVFSKKDDTECYYTKKTKKLETKKFGPILYTFCNNAINASFDQNYRDIFCSEMKQTLQKPIFDFRYFR